MAEPSWDADTGPGPQVTVLHAGNCVEDWATAYGFRNAVCFRRKSVGGTVVNNFLIFGSGDPNTDTTYDAAEGGSIYVDTDTSGKIWKKTAASTWTNQT